VTLKIYLLGQFKLQNDDQPVELPSRPAQSLFAYLAMHAGIPHRREKLAGLLWPDSTEENARSYLRQALWRIKKSLEEHDIVAEDFLSVDKINILFLNQADYWLDTQELLRKTDSLSLEELSRISQQYQGELLPGFYDEWVSPERERFEAVFQQKVAHLTDALLQEQLWEEAIARAEDWIRLVPVPEAAYRALMRAHAALGNPAIVHTTFERCRKALASDLGIEISPETAELLTRLTAPAPAANESARSISPQSIPPPDFIMQAEIEEPDPPVFVARQDELALLSSHLEDALEGKQNVVFVTGEAGSGKTALLHKFTQLALARHPELVVANGNCNAQTGIGDPYLPMREVLEMLAGDIESRLEAGSLTREQALRLWAIFPKTFAAIAGHGPDLIGTFIPDKTVRARAQLLEKTAPALAEQLKNHLDLQLPQRYSTGIQQLAFFEQYTRVLRELASSSPIMLVLDDLQWADQGSIGLLFHLGREIAGCPILILGSFRREEISLGRGQDRHPLEPVIHEFQRLFGTRSVDLGSADTQEFVSQLLDSEPNQLGEAFREKLYRQTQGHALFTVELLRKMQETGELRMDHDGLWQEGVNLDWERMPARVEAVLAERIKRLPASAQSVLSAASVQGEIFTAEILAEALGLNAAELLPLLSIELDRTHRLIRAESIQRVGDQLSSNYRFRHTLFQKFLYGNLDEIERVHLHQAIGEAAEGFFQDQPVPAANALQLARHFEISGLIEKAIEYLHQAGDRAVQLSAYAEGVSHLSRALELLEGQPKSAQRDEKELALQFSIAMSWKYNWASMQGSQAITRIRELSKELGLNAPLIRMLGEQSIYHYILADYERALESASECLALAQQEGDTLLITEAHWLLGVFTFSTGQYQSALEHLEEVNAFYIPEEHHPLMIKARGVDSGLSAQSYRACCLWCLGYPDQAIRLSEQTVRLAREFDHPFTLADVLSYAGCLLYALVGDGAALEEYARSLASLSKKSNLSLSGWASMSNYFLGDALILQSRSEQAIPVIEAALAASGSTGVDLYKPVALGFLAKALLEVEQSDAALDNLDKALVIVSDTGEKMWEVELLRLRGLAMQSIGNRVDAEADFKKGIETARSQEAKSWELRVAMDLACLWSDQGKRDDASKLLSDCYQWFTEGFETPDLKRARELLDSMV
jgi:predicted ATPase/DNA-binding SARP family transcriptional activator